MPKEMSPPDEFVSCNVEIASMKSLGVTGGKEIGLIVMYLLLILLILGWILHLLAILLIHSVSFKDSDESAYYNNPRDDVMN